ncbi:hypothetical protein GW931_01570 [archaeon]|nr:hypothetical protein [archaeon]
MSELTVEQIIKLIVGALVVVAVVLGVYFIFKDRILEFFNLLPTNASLGNFWRIFYG